MNRFALFLETLTFLGFFAALVIAWYFYIQARNRERMALIEKGVDTSEIFKAIKFPRFEFPWLKLGMLTTGFGIGLGFTILFLEFFPDSNFRQPIFVFSMLFFGGLSMMLASRIRSRNEQQNG